MRIRISVAGRELEAELDENESAEAIADALPLEGRANVWGDEIYFQIPVTLEESPDARADVEVGTLAYWPPGGAFCIFYGPTPASTGPSPRAASPVNEFGRILGDATELKGVESGAAVLIEAA